MPDYSGEIFLTDRLKDAPWTIVENQTANGEAGGSGQGIEFGRPKWFVQLSYGNMKDAPHRALDAFVLRRRGMIVPFTMFRVSKRTPLLHPDATNSGVGLGTVDISASTIQLTGVSGKTFSPGDMVSYRTLANGYWVGEVLETVVASGSNATLPVHPYPMTKHASAPAPRIVDALGLFRLSGQPRNSESHNRFSSIQLEALQHVY